MGKSYLRREKGSELSHDELDDTRAPEINQTTHGLAVGDLVYRDSATSWAKAQANAASTLADGIVVHVEDSNNCSVSTVDGTWITISSHGFGATGTALYLSQGTAGLITATEPSNGYVQPVGKVIDTNTVLFRLGAIASLT